MKRIYLFVTLMTVVMFCGQTSVYATDGNTIYAKDLTITKGETTATCEIHLTNEVTMCGCQFNLVLPDGVTVHYAYDDEEEEYVWGVTKGGRLRTEHGVSIVKQVDGSYLLIIADLTTNKNFYNTDAKKGLPLVSLALDIEGTVASGSYDIMVKDMILNHNENSTITEYKPSDTAALFLIKPTSGVEQHTEGGKLSFASAEGECVSKAAYQEEVGKQTNLTSVDLRGAELASDITADDLKQGLSENAIVLLPEGSEITGDNIVVDRVCSNLVISDGNAFKAPTNFTATNASYSRDLTGFGTICLPYAPSTDGFAYYELAEEAGESLRFIYVTSPKANTPYLYKKTGTGSVITGSGVEISADGAGEADMEGDNWKMVGTYETVTLTYPTDDIYALSGGVLYHNTGNLTMKPFRAYFKKENGPTVKSVNIIVEDETTGISQTESEVRSEELGVRSYNLAGQKVAEGYKGIVIKNGKKVLVK